MRQNYFSDFTRNGGGRARTTRGEGSSNGKRIRDKGCRPALVTVRGPATDSRAGAGGACAASHDVIAELDDTWGVTGNVTVKVEPFPKALSASMDPPKSSVNCFTI